MKNNMTPIMLSPPGTALVPPTLSSSHVVGVPNVPPDHPGPAKTHQMSLETHHAAIFAEVSTTG